MYLVKEIYLTLQGEGHHTGRTAVFCRFTGCNLWSGREKDRPSAICPFCDTDFRGTDGVNGGRYKAEKLVEKCLSFWPIRRESRFVVLTGGEPALQVDDQLIHAFHRHHFEVAIETNGTIVLPEHIDWICVSPKAGTEIVQTWGEELKMVYPQEALKPESFVDWEFDYFYLQPMDGEALLKNTQLAIAYCQQNPKWRLSLQSHKLVGIP